MASPPAKMASLLRRSTEPELAAAIEAALCELILACRTPSSWTVKRGRVNRLLSLRWRSLLSPCDRLAVNVALVCRLREVGCGNCRRCCSVTVATGRHRTILLDGDGVRARSGNRKAFLLIHVKLQDPFNLSGDLDLTKRELRTLSE